MTFWTLKLCLYLIMEAEGDGFRIFSCEKYLFGKGAGHVITCLNLLVKDLLQWATKYSGMGL